MNAQTYRSFFAFTKEPFGADLRIEEILISPALQGVKDRLEYSLRLGALAVVTGEVGSGKSTALRYATSHLHPSEWRLLWVTASCGSILELYRQLCWALEMETRSYSRAVMARIIQSQIQDSVEGKKQKVALVIDEASLLRLEVFMELHTLTQFQADSKPMLPIIFAGQNNLLDKLLYRTSLPLSSRVVARSHLEGVNRQDMERYLNHHLKIAGVKQSLFSEQAITAIHQGSGGLFRRANHLARGALIAAAAEKCQLVAAEHVRIASTELIA
jgi:type II secretory pathway predicted ATPase ExeA